MPKIKCVRDDSWPHKIKCVRDDSRPNKITVIYGPAGTGKTEYLSEIIRATCEKTNSFIVCAPTHSAVENIRKRVSVVPEAYFKTIYSFFRIDYLNDDIIGPLKQVEYLFIDEFGLIKKELFKRMIHFLNEETEVFISGDVVQLNPIYLSKRLISFQRLKRDYRNVDAFIAEHDFNNVFSTKLLKQASKVLLTENKRSNDAVLELIHDVFFTSKRFNFPLINVVRAINLVMNEGYVFISSKYEHLNSINALIVPRFKDVVLYGNWAFKVGFKYLLCDEYQGHHNGEILTCSYLDKRTIVLTAEDEEKLELNDEISLLPEYLITAHKSQGMSIDKIIVCLDDLFDISMLYTMITRARSSVVFFAFKRPDEQLYENIETFKSLLKFYNYI